MASTAAVGSDGGLWTWGAGPSGQLGHGVGQNQPVPRRVQAQSAVRVVGVSAGAFHTMAVANDGRLYTWGSGTDGQLGHGNNQSQLVPALVSTVVVRGVSNSSNR